MTAPRRLGILACENLRREVEAVLALEAIGDVSLLTFPAHCGRLALDWETLEKVLAAAKEDCARIHLFGGACCVALGEAPGALAHCRMEQTAQCFALLAPDRLVAAYQS